MATTIKTENDAVEGSVSAEKVLIDAENRRIEARKATDKPTEDMIAPGSDIYNLHTKRKHLVNEIAWSSSNYDAILQALVDGRATDIGLLPKVRGEPILIVGSGPTLDEILPTIKDWEGDVICSPSQASTLVYYGKEPTYILALDPDETPPPMAVDTWEGRNSRLLVHPGINPWLISPHYFNRLSDGIVQRIENKDAWPGKFGLYRKMEPQTPFYGNAQKIGYSHIDRKIEPTQVTLSISSYIGTEIVMLGCVANAQIFVATLLGYSTLYLAGVDFGCPGNIDRFTSWVWKDGAWVRIPPPPLDMDKVVFADNGVPSQEIHMFYKRNFMSAWRLEKAQIINCGVNALHEVPYAPWETVLKQQGVMGGAIKGLTKKEIIEVSERYMARQNTFVIQYQGGGIQFTEFAEGVVGVVPYLDKLVERGVGNLDFNATIKGIKNLARAGVFNDETKKLVEAIEYRDGPRAGNPELQQSVLIKPSEEPLTTVTDGTVPKGIAAEES